MTREVLSRRVGTYSTGMRRAELVALRIDDYNPTSGKLIVRAGKGNKDRTVWTAPGMLRLTVDAWLEVRGDEPGSLFLPVNRGGQVSFRALSMQAIQGILKRRAGRAGVEHLTPHDFRRTNISDLLDAGADISTVARLAGHNQVTTTALYDRRDERAKQAAASLLSVPC